MKRVSVGRLVNLRIPSITIILACTAMFVFGEDNPVGSSEVNRQDAQDKPISAVVVDKKGRWFISGSDLAGEQSIEVGHALHAGAVLSTNDSTGESSIALGLLRGRSSGRTLLHSCNAGSCKTRIEVPAGDTPPTLAERFLASAQRLLSGNPHRFAVLASRSVHSESVLTFSESLLTPRGDVLEVTPRLLLSADASTDVRHRLRLRPIDGHDRLEPLGEAVEVVLRVRGNRIELQPQALVRPGLYDMRSRSEADKRRAGRSAGDGAWVLVATPDRSHEFREAFASAVNLTAKWRPEVSERAIRRLLRAYLVSLSREQ